MTYLHPPAFSPSSLYIEATHVPQVPHLSNGERKALSSQASSVAQSRWGSRCPQAGPGPGRLCDITPGCYGSSQKAAQDAAALGSPCSLAIRAGIGVTCSHRPMRRWSRGRVQPKLQMEGGGKGRIKLRQVVPHSSELKVPSLVSFKKKKKRFWSWDSLPFLEAPTFVSPPKLTALSGSAQFPL